MERKKINIFFSGLDTKFINRLKSNNYRIRDNSIIIILIKDVARKQQPFVLAINRGGCLGSRSGQSRLQFLDTKK